MTKIPVRKTLVYHCLCATGFKGQTCDEGKNCQYIFIIIGGDADLRIRVDSIPNIPGYTSLRVVHSNACKLSGKGVREGVVKDLIDRWTGIKDKNTNKCSNWENKQMKAGM